MSERQQGGERDSFNPTEIAKLLDEQVVQAFREGDGLDLCEELLMIIWNRIQPTLGRITMTAIMERAVERTKEPYPMVAALWVSPDGISLEPLRQQTEENGYHIRDAVMRLIANLIEILVTLTGDILVRQLLQDIERRRAT